MMNRNNIWNHLKKQIFAGIVFSIPVFVFIPMARELWQELAETGNKIASSLGLKTLIGSSLVPVLSAISILLIFYWVGWFVRISTLIKVRDWIEQSALQYIPGYLSYKVKMKEKLLPKKYVRKPIWVSFGNHRKPGFLIEENESDAVVYFPNAPDSNNGQVVVVERQQISLMDCEAETLIRKLQANGRTLIT